jgi:hypothetical protein
MPGRAGTNELEVCCAVSFTERRIPCVVLYRSTRSFPRVTNATKKACNIGIFSEFAVPFVLQPSLCYNEMKGVTPIFSLLSDPTSSNICNLSRYHISPDNPASIASGYGLDGREVGVRGPIKPRFFFSPRCPDRLLGPLSLLSRVGIGVSFPGSKVAGA